MLQEEVHEACGDFQKGQSRLTNFAYLCIWTNNVFSITYYDNQLFLIGIYTRGATENHQEFKLGKTTKAWRRAAAAAALFYLKKSRSCSILKNQGLTSLTLYGAPVY
jgi:hypothetical protein